VLILGKICSRNFLTADVVAYCTQSPTSRSHEPGYLRAAEEQHTSKPLATNQRGKPHFWTKTCRSFGRKSLHPQLLDQGVSLQTPFEPTCEQEPNQENGILSCSGKSCLNRSSSTVKPNYPTADAKASRASAARNRRWPSKISHCRVRLPDLSRGWKPNCLRSPAQEAKW
jgi:hypothetical protein